VTKAERRQILLTNDDGIRSPGLWSAAEALSALGFVTVVAPREQSSGSGRSMPHTSDGMISEETVEVGGKTWSVYAVGGTPAQAVMHGVLELMPARPALMVSGINYGSNAGLGVTISGTVGAALEGAAFGIPSLAISMETTTEQHRSYAEDVDFSAAAYFTRLFARKLLALGKYEDVSVLKVEIPSTATPRTPWRICRLSQQRFYEPIKPLRASLQEAKRIDYRLVTSNADFEPGTDAYVLCVSRQVAVTPLSLDMTSRIDLDAFAARLREKPRKKKEGS
jgi:5'-nucleotidase